ncbi:hypothetical protein ACHAPG_011586, partial [Botrytis cinerea]
MAFHYDILPSDHSFRILELNPGHDHNSPLRGSLKLHSIKSPPRYEALSYVWGLAGHNESLECNGQDFKITASLDTALKRVRSAHSSILIWVDQICINQSDISERSQQVSIMKEIYSGAEIVSAWLGPGDPERVKSVAETMKILANGVSSLLKERFSLIFINDDHPMERPPSFPQDEFLRQMSLPIRSSPIWNDFNSMLTLPYFSRIWIIQEIAVSRAFRMLWGNVEIPGHVLRNALTCAKLHSMDERDIITHSPVLSLGNVPRILYSEGNHIQDLLALVLQTGNQQATDGRDKIFALIGLSHNNNLMPDYSQTEASLFKEFALQEITRSNLKILSYTNVVDPFITMKPLWAPQWSPPNNKINGALINLGFNASNRDDIIRDITFNSQFLVLKGLQIDEVKAVSDLVSYENGIVFAISSFFKVVTQNEDLFQKKYGLEFIRPFLLTMLVNRKNNPVSCLEAIPIQDDIYLDTFIREACSSLFRRICHSASEIDITRDECVSVLSLLRAAVNATPTTTTTGMPWFKEDETFQFLRTTLEKLFPDDDEQVLSFYDVFKRMRTSSRGRDEAERWQFNEIFFRYTIHRRFFITESGYIGLGPPCMKDGDSVCILFGGTTPYIVRPTPTTDEYFFLGES